MGCALGFFLRRVFLRFASRSHPSMCAPPAPLPAHSCTNPFRSLPSANIQAATAAQMFPIKLRAMPTNFGTHESVLRNGPPQIPFIFFPPTLPFLQVFLNVNGFHAATAGGGLPSQAPGASGKLVVQVSPAPCWGCANLELLPRVFPDGFPRPGLSRWCFPVGDAVWRQQLQPSPWGECRRGSGGICCKSVFS